MSEQGQFRRYDHVERLGHSDVQDILLGEVHVFPKLDGTNASVWLGFASTSEPDMIVADASGVRDRVLCCGSRNRVVTPSDDNHGFASWAQGDGWANLSQVFVTLGDQVVVYGEWMVPHTLKTYRPDVWKRFFVFDVYDLAQHRYLSYDEYAPAVRAARLDLVEPLCVATNPTREQLETKVATNTYLIADGAGVGEGIVVKNYAWRNKYGRQPWSKIVRNEFKEDSARAFGVPKLGEVFQVEAAIVEEHVTPELVGKTRAKVVAAVANDNGVDLCSPNAQQLVEANYRGRVIPQLLERVYHDLVTEHIWEAIKRHRDPEVKFKNLRGHCVRRTKELAQDLFA